MAYNTLKGTVNFSNSNTGSIESMVDDYSNQTITGVKTFSTTVSASAFYSTTDGTLLTSSALSSIAGDGSGRVIVSDGDGTATGYSTLTYDGTTLTASVSGSAAALHSIPLEPYKVLGQLSASNIYFGDGLQDSSNKLAAQGGASIAVDGTGINVDLATTGGLAHDGGKLRADPLNATAKSSLTAGDKFLISDVDAGNVLKNATMTVLGTYMQSTLTFASPGGSDNQIQYRSSGNFTGNSNLTYDGTNTLTTVNVTASGHVSSSLFVGDGSGLTNVTTTHPPAGINQNIQFNSGSSFSGSSNLNFIYDGIVNVLQTVGDVSASNDFTGGQDLLLARDVQVGRDVIVTGQVSASQNVSGTAFYGHGNTLSTAPINNYQNTRLVICGASTDTIDTFSGLTWSNPLLSVPGNISVTTNISASGHVSSSLFVGDGSGLTNLPPAPTPGTNTQVIFNSGSSFGASSNFTFLYSPGTNQLKVVGDMSASNDLQAGNDLFVGRDIQATRDIKSLNDLSGSQDLFIGRDINVARDILATNNITATNDLSASAGVLGTFATFGTVHISGSDTEALRIAKGASDTREIVFENEGADVASIFVNAAETLIIKNESNNDDIQFQTKPGGVATTAFTIDGATAYVGVGTISPLTHLDIRWDPTGLSDNTGGGDVVLFGSGTLTAGKLYYLHTDGAWTETDADAVATGADQLLGIALGSDPTSDGVLIKGFFDATTYVSNFSAGKAIYVSTTAASMDTTAPSGAGDFVRIVGYCITTANVIYFNPSSEWIELA